MKYVPIVVQLVMLSLLIAGWSMFACGVIHWPSDPKQETALIALQSFLLLLVDVQTLIRWTRSVEDPNSKGETKDEKVPSSHSGNSGALGS